MRPLLLCCLLLVPTLSWTGTSSSHQLQPVVFTIDPSQSSVELTATLETLLLGSDTDRDTSSVVGDLTIDLSPTPAPFTQAQITALDMRFSEEIALAFVYSVFGTIDVEADPESLAVTLLRAGPAAPVAEGAFAQANNEIGFSGRVELEGTGLVGTAVPEGPFDFDISIISEMDAQLEEQGSQLTVTIPIDIAFEVDIDGSTLTGTVIGTIVATGPIPTDVEAEVFPQPFILLQNYPNPFAQTTTVAYTLSKAEQVKLTVYNALGEEVASLTDAYQVPGRYTQAWHAEGLPSGLYFYQLRVGDYRVVKKMTLLR